jgi:hypothetical protein
VVLFYCLSFFIMLVRWLVYYFVKEWEEGSRVIVSFGVGLDDYSCCGYASWLVF